MFAVLVGERRIKMLMQECQLLVKVVFIKFSSVNLDWGKSVWGLEIGFCVQVLLSLVIWSVLYIYSFL